jgi:hypothetical protein
VAEPLKKIFTTLGIASPEELNEVVKIAIELVYRGAPERGQGPLYATKQLAASPEDVVVEPLRPRADLTDPSVAASADIRVDNDWVLTVTLNATDDPSNLASVEKPMMQFRLVANVLVIFGGAVLDESAYNAIRYIHFYRAIGGPITYTAHADSAVRLRGAWPLYFVSFGGRFISVGPNEDVKITVELRDGFVLANRPSTGTADVKVGKVMLIPALKFVREEASKYAASLRGS